MNPCYVVRRGEIEKTLAQEPVVGKRALEPLKALAAEHRLPFKIIEDHQVPTSLCEVHVHEGDLWQVLEGSVRFVVGGEMVDPYHPKNADGSLNMNEILANEIKGGTEHMLEVGDWLWIPPGQPHLHTCEGTARLLIVKV